MWKNKDMQEKSNTIQACLQENLGAEKINIDYEVFSDNESDNEIDLEVESSDHDQEVTY